MQSSLKNIDITLAPNEIEDLHIGIVWANEWNKDITQKLFDSAVKTLIGNGVQQKNIVTLAVPGTFELTYAAQRLVTSVSLDAVIVIGCVIKGDTPHFDYVCQSVTQGSTLLNAHGSVPIIFTVLTTLTREQALERAGGSCGDKGAEGALTAIQMAGINLHVSRVCADEKRL